MRSICPNLLYGLKWRLFRETSRDDYMPFLIEMSDIFALPREYLYDHEIFEQNVVRSLSGMQELEYCYDSLFD